MAFQGFSGVELLHQGGQALVFRARREADGRAVVLKALRGPYPAADALQRFRREAEITARVQGPGVAVLLESHVDGAEPFLVLEDFGARSVADHLRDRGPLPPELALHLALQALAALARVHDLLVVHKDINPSNMVWNPDADRLELIDFGIASTVSRQRPSLASPSILRGTLPYIAPEQTGRMNRSVDYRSDYYALGASLFELLTGRPPFVGDDPLELVHAHVTRPPPDPRALVPSLPEDLSAVVVELLQKSADQRYQSAFGLRHDLERCRASLRGERAGRSFLLRRQDRPSRVQQPGQLYGRAGEIAALEGALRRVAGGTRELVLVEGAAGVGKTALIHELHRPMVETGGVFVSGKFDQFRRGLPYASLADAFGQLCMGLMTASPVEIAGWRQRLQGALGDSAQALVDLVPELGLLLGPQPPAPEVPPAEAEQRLHLLFRRFARTLASDGQALVLFVDDLQWADLPTIRLFTHLATDPATSHLLLVGAWRSEEVGPAHPLTHALAQLREGGVPITSLAPAPLGIDHVRAYLVDALHQRDEALDELAATCLARTGGNPFFLAQYVGLLERSGALRFDQAEGRWRWDPAAIAALGFTDNVLSLMAEAIRGLPEDSRRAVRVASLLGAEVTLPGLAEVVGTDEAALRAALRPAQEAGLVIQVGEAADAEVGGGEGERYAFVHDRVQQAAYGMLEEEERAALHLVAGQALRARHPDLEDREELFEVVGHLLGARALHDAAARLDLARLSAAAGRRAREQAAWDAARHFLSAALDLLGPDPFAVDAELAHQVHRDAGVAAYLAQDYDGSDRHVDALLAHAERVLDRVAALEIRMAAQLARNQSAEAITTGLQALALLGIELPEHPDLPRIQESMQTCGALVAAADLAALPDAAVIEDPERRAAMRLLNALTPPAYLVRPLLMPVLAAAIVTASLQDGLGPESAYGFAVYGLVLCDAGFIDAGYAMGRLAMALTQRFPDARRVAVRTGHVWNGFVRHRKEPLHDTLDEYAALYAEGIDIGDFEYAHFVAMLTAMCGVEAGLPLDRFEPQVDRYTRSHQALAQDASLALHGVVHQLMLNLMGRAEDDTVLVGSVYDERTMLPLFEQLQHPTGLFVVHHYRCFLLYMLGEYDQARQSADQARQHVQAGGTATFHLPVFFTLDALLALREYERTGDPAELARAEDGQSRVDGWAAHAPGNLAHKSALLRAERARVDGDPAALDAFVQAVRAARGSRFLYDEAIANRLAAGFYEQRGDDTAARAHLAEARYALLRWGAVAAVRRLDREHPQLASRLHHDSAMTGTWTVSEGADLDAEAVIQASQAISQEIRLDGLVCLLLKIALESSSARRAALLLARSGSFVVAAVGRAEPDIQTELLDPWRPFEQSDHVPVSVINYVVNTGREILVDDARSKGLFTSDPHVQRHDVRALLALPVVHQGQLEAILYLDNDQTAGVFTSARLALARVLLAQAAISIENATHYQQLEQRVAERTAQLEQARAEAEQAHREADALLKNALPEKIAEELKATGRARPVFVPQATVLFTDFRGFTAVAESLSPEELVDELEECFTFFDGIVARWGVEKLKTIGDAYMAVGGVPERSATHVVDSVMVALEMIASMQRPRGDGAPPPFRVRIGLHTGPLVAGVIGRRRFAYDVWGDTVNVAARMENTSEPGRVNVSAATWAQAAPFFVGQPRGLVAAKGKGEIEMFYIDGLRPEYSVDGDGITPNQAFWDARDALLAERG
ncbi:MAG: AAA family ATPase [Alphaproteobacteria bacterium]|nr:AAA family ATPase [Alphaproteobacteria bacterium]